MPIRMHEGEVEIDEPLVRRLLASQTPELAELPLRVVEPWGTDHAIWRLGDAFVVRLPRIEWAAHQPEHEVAWLPLLAAGLTTSTPTPVALGCPGFGYPFNWVVHRWLAGTPAGPDSMRDPDAFALDLAGAIAELRHVPAGDGPPARGRARRLADYDDATRAAIDSARALIDAPHALALWDEALAAREPVALTWVHGDIDGNCLVDTEGRLCGIIDWGSACVGDPAVDVQVVWSPLFTPRTRERFVHALDIDEATLARSRGAALHQACAALPYYLTTYPLMVERSVHKLRALGLAARI